MEDTELECKRNFENKQQIFCKKVIDLHVFVVPIKLWIEKYRTIYNHAVIESTSAGFIRITSNLLLKDVRKVIDEQLGHDIVPKEFVFLRSVGRCLAVVNAGQEFILTAKDFIPPEAYSPELFLLPCTHVDLMINEKLTLENTSPIRGISSVNARQNSSIIHSTDVPTKHDYIEKSKTEIPEIIMTTTPVSGWKNEEKEYLISSQSNVDVDEDMYGDGEGDSDEGRDDGNNSEDNENTADKFDQGFDPNNNLQLSVLEARMKKRYVEEEKRLRNSPYRIRFNGGENEKDVQRNEHSPEFNEGNVKNRLRKHGREENLSFISPQGTSNRHSNTDENVSNRQMNNKDEATLHKNEKMERLKKENQEEKPFEEDKHELEHTETNAMKKQKVEELNQKVEKIRAEKYTFQKEREYLVKKSRSMHSEVASKLTQNNNDWRKKFVEEKKQTTVLEEAILKSKNEIEVLYKKLNSTQIVEEENANFVTKDQHGSRPSELNNKKKLVLRLQRQNEELKSRIDVIAKQFEAEAKMRGIVQKEVKDLRQRASEVKINANRAKNVLAQPGKYFPGLSVNESETGP